VNDYLNQGMLTYLCVSITFILIALASLVMLNKQARAMDEINRKLEVITNEALKTSQAAKGSRK